MSPSYEALHHNNLIVFLHVLLQICEQDLRLNCINRASFTLMFICTLPFLLQVRALHVKTYNKHASREGGKKYCIRFTVAATQ